MALAEDYSGSQVDWSEQGDPHGYIFHAYNKLRAAIERLARGEV